MIFRVHDHIAARAVDDEVIIFDARSGGYLGLNATGAAIWDVLASGRSAEHAVEALVTLFDVDRATAERDVTLLLRELQSLDLISPLTP